MRCSGPIDASAIISTSAVCLKMTSSTSLQSFRVSMLEPPFALHEWAFVFCLTEGTIPESLSRLRNLEELWLNGNRLTGSIPSSIGELSQLRELYLNSNELTGPLPESLSKLTNLEALDVSWNKLTGQFPSSLIKLVSCSAVA